MERASWINATEPTSRPGPGVPQPIAHTLTDFEPPACHHYTKHYVTLSAQARGSPSAPDSRASKCACIPVLPSSVHAMPFRLQLWCGVKCRSGSMMVQLILLQDPPSTYIGYDTQSQPSIKPPEEQLMQARSHAACVSTDKASKPPSQQTPYSAQQSSVGRARPGRKHAPLDLASIPVKTENMYLE
jgi:hypothetical protein